MFKELKPSFSRGCLGVFLVLFGLSVLADEQRARIALVSASPEENSQPVAQELKRRLPRADIEVISPVDITRFSPDISIALSPAAVQGLLDSNSSTPTIATLTTEEACAHFSQIFSSRPKKIDFTCVATVPAPKIIFAYVKLLYPAAPRALVFVSKETESLIENYKSAARDQGVTLDL